MGNLMNGRSGLLKVKHWREQKVSIPHGKPAALLRGGGVDHWDVRLHRMRPAINAFTLKVGAFPIECMIFTPEASDVVEPLLRHGVTIAMLRRQIYPESVVFRFVPPGDDIQTDSAV